MRDFLAALWQPTTGHGELRMICEGKVIQDFIPLAQHDPFGMAAKAVAEWDLEGYDVYFGVLRRTKMRGTAEDVVDHAGVLWAMSRSPGSRNRPRWLSSSSSANDRRYKIGARESSTSTSSARAAVCFFPRLITQ